MEEEKETTERESVSSDKDGNVERESESTTTEHTSSDKDDNDDGA